MMKKITRKITEELLKVDSRTLTPLEVSNIVCVEVRPNYDSTWRIETKSGNSYKLVRFDHEELEDIRGMVEMIPFEEILVKVLSAKDCIYYD